MFGLPGRLERKPSSKWSMEDVGTGIFASKDYPGSFTGLNIPRDLTDEQRDLVLWAFESGYRHGCDDGMATIKADFKRLMGL